MHQVHKDEKAKGERITLVSKKDLDISYFVGTGAGGQNKQKNATGCQMIHRASGALGRCSALDHKIRTVERHSCACMPILR